MLHFHYLRLEGHFVLKHFFCAKSNNQLHATNTDCNKSLNALHFKSFFLLLFVLTPLIVSEYLRLTNAMFYLKLNLNNTTIKKNTLIRPN